MRKFFAFLVLAAAFAAGHVVFGADRSRDWCGDFGCGCRPEGKECECIEADDLDGYWATIERGDTPKLGVVSVVKQAKDLYVVTWLNGPGTIQGGMIRKRELLSVSYLESGKLTMSFYALKKAGGDWTVQGPTEVWVRLKLPAVMKMVKAEAPWS